MIKIEAAIVGSDVLGNTLLDVTIQTVTVQATPCVLAQDNLQLVLVDAGLSEAYQYVACAIRTSTVLPAQQGYVYEVRMSVTIIT